MARAEGQAPQPALKVIRDLEISGVTNDLSPVSSIAVSPRGWIAIGQRDDNRVLTFGQDGRLLFSFGRGGEGPGEFRRMTAYSGWRGDTLWVTDIGTRRATFIGPDGKLVRVLPFPRPNSARRTIPARAPSQGDPTPFAFVSDQDVGLSSGVAGVPQPAAWRDPLKGVTSVIWIQRIDGSAATMLGAIRSTSASCMKGAPPRQLLECFPPTSALSPVAGRLLTVSEPAGRRAADGLLVQVVGGYGDTLVNRIIPFRMAPMTDAVSDSVRGRCAEQAPTPARQSECRSQPVAPYLRPVFRSLLGLDHSIWIELRPDATGRHWLLLKPNGDPVGQVTLPATFFLRVASTSMLWGTVEDADGIESLVRYRIGA
jgi:hypothetical protein